ncbi:MAG TPA: GNAT family N-acetyltransferase [Candidatus Dormibacteraeota bacterium]|nr:GNAT family N-acetyltransferase [Candidatus Dormibacteraeota bacterium]
MYASTRDAEMALVPWDDETKQRFIDQQFHAQSVHYASNYPDADFDLVLVDEQLAGRLYVQRRGDGIDLLDIALLSAFRNRGVGTRLMLRLVDEAHGAGVPLRLHVERFNPARHLYDRLGFAEIEDRGVYAYMELRPEGSS